MTNVPTSGAGSNWTKYLIPDQFFTTIAHDISTLKTCGLNFQDERVNAAAKRMLYTLGMAFGGLLFLDILMASIFLAIEVLVAGGIILICRDLFERSLGQKGSVASVLENKNQVVNTLNHLNSNLF